MTLEERKSSPKFSPMDKIQSELFLWATMSEIKKVDDNAFSPPVEMLPLAQIMRTRIAVLELPMKYTNLGLIAAMCLVKNPGQAVFLICDFLDKMPKDSVLTPSSLSELYPAGFWTEEEFGRIVDEELKTGKHPYAWVYCKKES